ncbi:MAG: alpha/beta fold hydrolase [Actinobacteria bacterium]|nr:MAG: alpha/beta fold hydrolase [Actinomycetota bacterium]
MPPTDSPARLQTARGAPRPRAGASRARRPPPGSGRRSVTVDQHEIVLHGRRVVYRAGGSGPGLLLVHGITSSSDTWLEVLEPLARHFTVLAPDLPGHGHSEAPAGDYSMGAYANGLRDLLVALEHERATLVGHSLGGGVVMQLAYQFPELCERLVLVSSGGLGPEVHGLLRAATLPLAEHVLPWIAADWIRGGTARLTSLAQRLGLEQGADMREALRGHASLATPTARAAFVHTLRAAVDPGGQRVDARDRLYLAEDVPTLILWGESDWIIPARHGHEAHAAIPGSRLEILGAGGHFPHVQEPAWFVEALERFIEETDPARPPGPDQLRARLRQRARLGNSK